MDERKREEFLDFFVVALIGNELQLLQENDDSRPGNSEFPYLFTNLNQI